MSVIVFHQHPRPKDPWWYPPPGVDGEAWLAAMREVDGWCPSLAENIPPTMERARFRRWEQEVEREIGACPGELYRPSEPLESSR